MGYEFFGICDGEYVCVFDKLIVACLFIWRISCTYPLFSFCSHDDCFELIWKLKKVPGIMGTFSLILFPWNHTTFSTHFVLLHFGFCFVHIFLNDVRKVSGSSFICFFLHMEYVFCFYVYVVEYTSQAVAYTYTIYYASDCFVYVYVVRHIAYRKRFSNSTWQTDNSCAKRSFINVSRETFSKLRFTWNIE